MNIVCDKLIAEKISLSNSTSDHDETLSGISPRIKSVSATCCLFFLLMKRTKIFIMYFFSRQVRGLHDLRSEMIETCDNCSLLKVCVITVLYFQTPLKLVSRTLRRILDNAYKKNTRIWLQPN